MHRVTIARIVLISAALAVGACSSDDEDLRPAQGGDDSTELAAEGAALADDSIEPTAAAQPGGAGPGGDGRTDVHRAAELVQDLRAEAGSVVVEGATLTQAAEVQVAGFPTEIAPELAHLVGSWRTDEARTLAGIRAQGLPLPDDAIIPVDRLEIRADGSFVQGAGEHVAPDPLEIDSPDSEFEEPPIQLEPTPRLEFVEADGDRLSVRLLSAMPVIPEEVEAEPVGPTTTDEGVGVFEDGVVHAPGAEGFDEQPIEHEMQIIGVPMTIHIDGDALGLEAPTGPTDPSLPPDAEQPPSVITWYERAQ